MNNIINYFKLYNYFKSEKGGSLNRAEALRNIWRTRNLPQEFKEVVFQIIEGNAKSVANFQVNGITLRQLYKEEGMKLMQAVFFLDWLRREPNNAYAFLASGRYRNPINIDENEKQEILIALERLQKQKGIEIPSIMVPEDTSESDINTKEDSEFKDIMTADSLDNHINNNKNR